MMEKHEEESLKEKQEGEEGAKRRSSKAGGKSRIWSSRTVKKDRKG